MTKKAFLLIYGDFIQDYLNEESKILRYADVELSVSMPCTSILNTSDIKDVYGLKMMNKETAAYHIFNLLGISVNDIDLNPQSL